MFSQLKNWLLTALAALVGVFGVMFGIERGKRKSLETEALKKSNEKMRSRADQLIEDQMKNKKLREDREKDTADIDYFSK